VIHINVNNAEEILFSNNFIRESLPEFQKIFNQWDLCKSNLILRGIAKKTIVELLQNLSGEDIVKISNILGEFVTIDNLGHHIVKNVSLPLECEKELNNLVGLDNFSISRDKDKIYISFWR